MFTHGLRSHYATITQSLRKDYAVITQRLRRHYAKITQTLRNSLRRHYANITQFNNYAIHYAIALRNCITQLHYAIAIRNCITQLHYAEILKITRLRNGGNYRDAEILQNYNGQLADVFISSLLLLSTAASEPRQDNQVDSVKLFGMTRSWAATSISAFTFGEAQNLKLLQSSDYLKKHVQFSQMFFQETDQCPEGNAWLG